MAGARNHGAAHEYTAPHSVDASFRLCVAAMLSAIIFATDAIDGPARADFVARCLASLVEACVQGVVADAVLVGETGRGFDKIAEDAGCGFIETSSAAEGLRQALASVRRDQIFLLSAGYAVERGFADELNDLFAYGDAGAPRTLRAASTTFATRLFPGLSRPAGVVAPHRALTGIDACFDAEQGFSRLAGKLKGADLSTRARRLT
jgi:hypothetical protein